MTKPNEGQATAERGKLRRIWDVIHDIADRAEDEGDRMYFGSTNDPHTLRRQLRYLDKIIADAAMSPQGEAKSDVEAVGITGLASAVGYAGAVLFAHAEKLPVPAHAKGLAARCQEASAILAAMPKQGEAGYQDAFYQLAALMGLSASPATPRHVWETEMLPRLQCAFGQGEAKPVVAGLVEALELVVGSLKFDREDDLNREVLRRVNAALARASEQPS